MKPGSRYYLLDVARGIAAFCVVMFHYRLFYEKDISLNSLIKNEQPFYKILQLPYEFGWMAVQFFFVLSGFIFYDLYLKKIKSKKISFKKFFILRFSRLYPLHFLTLMIMIMMFFLFRSNNISFFNIEADIKHFILNIFLIHEWGLKDFDSFNRPSWSISIEIMMYGIFFFVFSKKVNDWYISIVLIIISVPVFFIYKNIGYGGYCFFIGGLSSLIYDFCKNNYITKKSLIIFSSIFILSVILIFFIKNNYLVKIIAFSLTFPSLIISLMFYQNINIKSGKSLSFIGDISYSVYLIHYVVQSIICFGLAYLEIKVNFNSNIIFTSYIVLIFILSIITFNFFERPLQNLIRKNS